MADDNADAAAVGGGGAPAKNPMVGIMLIINAVVMAGVGFLQYRAYQRDAHTPKIRDVIKAELKEVQAEIEEKEMGIKKKGEGEGLLFPLEGFTANLTQGDGPRRYVRLNMVLKFSSGSKEDEVKARQPQVRDAVISILNAKRPEDLMTVEGKAYLKEEIKAAINSFLVESSLVDIFYVGFQIN